GALELTGIERSAGGLAVVSRSTIGERGRPIEVLPDGAFWVSDAFVRRATIDATGAVIDVTSVAWSPAPIEGATLMATHDVTQSPVTAPPTVTLAWYGRLQGGAIMGFASDDSVAFSPDLKDRVAALMGWNPWTIWQEALGQALASLLAGVAVTMGLTPVLFLLTLLALRIPALDARPAATGVLIGVILPVLVVLVINLRFPSPELTAALSPSSLVTGAPFFVIGG